MYPLITPGVLSVSISTRGLSGRGWREGSVEGDVEEVRSIIVEIRGVTRFGLGTLVGPKVRESRMEVGESFRMTEVVLLSGS